MTTIAILGTSGYLFQPVINALTSKTFANKVQFPIKALTSKDKESTDKVKYIKGQANDSSVHEEFKGVDVIISLVGRAGENLPLIEQLVIDSKPKFYIPSEFGCENDIIEKDLRSPVANGKNQHAEYLTSKGIKVVRIFTNFFRIPPLFLYQIKSHIGIDEKAGTLTLVGDDNVKVEDKTIDFSKQSDIGRVVAAVATTDVSKVLTRYRVRSGRIPLSYVVNDIEKEGKKLTIKRISVEDQINALKKDITNFPLALFTYYGLGEGKGASFVEVENEVINPGESLWKWESWDP